MVTFLYQHPPTIISLLFNQHFNFTVRLYTFSLVSIYFLLPANVYISQTFPAEQNIHENDTLDKLFADLDQNGDLEIDFKEFITLIAMVTSACQELFAPNQPNI